MPANITDPSGIEYALESKKGPSEEKRACPAPREHPTLRLPYHGRGRAFYLPRGQVRHRALQPRTASTTISNSHEPSPMTTCPSSRRRWPRPSAADLPFQRTEVSRPEAGDMFRDQPFKLEIIKAIKDDILGIYTHGPFSDLCNGPHVESTGGVPAFKLLSVAGAYWRGDENRPMLQRIYGTAFESQDALDLYLNRLKEAAKRDHRKLGRDPGALLRPQRARRGLDLLAPERGPGAEPRGGLLAGASPELGLLAGLLTPHRQEQAVGDQRPPAILQRKHVRPPGNRRTGLLPEADELPLPYPHVPILAPQLPRASHAPGGAGHRLPIRKDGCTSRSAPRPRLHPGRRPYLLPPRPARRRGTRRSRTHLPAPGGIRIQRLQDLPLRPPRKVCR